MAQISGQIILTVVLAAVGVIGLLIVLNLRTIKDCVRNFGARLDKQDEKIDNVAASQIECQRECTNQFVDKVDFIRNVNKQERTLETLASMTSEIKGSLKVFDKMPQMAGEIARQVTQELKR